MLLVGLGRHRDRNISRLVRAKLIVITKKNVKRSRHSNKEKFNPQTELNISESL